MEVLKSQIQFQYFAIGLLQMCFAVSEMIWKLGFAQLLPQKVSVNFQAGLVLWLG